MENTVYGKLFANRVVLCFFFTMLLMLASILRIAVIASNNYSDVQSEQASYRIEVSKLRGTIYDCNMIPLTNTRSKIMAAVAPTPKAIVGISAELEDDQLTSVLNTLSQNMPAVCTVDEKIDCDGIACTTVYEHNRIDKTACHIIGYTDDAGHGISGLELAYDDILYSGNGVNAVYTVDGKGSVLSGVAPHFENDLSIIKSGVVTTLDINIQKITENESAQLVKGSVVVASALDGKIRAMVSYPQFDVNNISESLESENSPLINRCLSAYSVGSVFKPCVAAAAIESNYDYYTFDCTGSTFINERIFRCHKLDGHGNMNLCTALAQSCNCYFYNFAISMGVEKIYNTSAYLNFGRKIQIADNFSTAEGHLPSISSITNESQIANLSIGQGELILSPVSMLTLYCAIASNGCYYLPSVVEKTIKGNEEEYYDIGNPTRVMSEKTAQKLRYYLQSVINEGTGTDAKPQNCTAAGKTATAQTGRYNDNGVEITNSWFCGFFPAQAPKYVVIIMSDGGADVTTASIFSRIADKITELENTMSP